MSTRTQLKNHHEIRVIFQRMALEIAESFADQESNPSSQPNTNEQYWERHDHASDTLKPSKKKDGKG